MLFYTPFCALLRLLAIFQFITLMHTLTHSHRQDTLAEFGYKQRLRVSTTLPHFIRQQNQQLFVLVESHSNLRRNTKFMPTHWFALTFLPIINQFDKWNIQCSSKSKTGKNDVDAGQRYNATKKYECFHLGGHRNGDTKFYHTHSLPAVDFSPTFQIFNLKFTGVSYENANIQLILENYPI